MICKKCYEDIEEKGQDNISPISGYPICEDCKDDIVCDNCYDSEGIYYVDEFEKILCKHCLVRKADKTGWVNSYTVYCDQDWNTIATDADPFPVIDYLEKRLDMQKIERR